MNRTYIQFLVCLTLVFLSTGCEDNWLDEQSSNQLTAEEQFETAEGFKDALIGSYIGLTAQELYGKDLSWNMVDLLSQQYAGLPVTAQYAGMQQFQYETLRANGQIEATWSKAYNTIANVNLALEMTEKNQAVLGSIDYALIRGELLGLRVFLHFDMMRLFNPGNLKDRPELLNEYAIPYVTTFDKNIKSQLSFTETFKLMEADLQEALTLLEEDPVVSEEPVSYYAEVNRDGFYDSREQRMNYYAVKALFARVLQWQGKQDEAAIVAQEVIDDSFAMLIDADSHPVATDRIFYQEVLFMIDVEGLADIINTLLSATDLDTANPNTLYYTSNYVDETFETDNVNVGIPDVRFNTLMVTQSRGVVNRKLFQNYQEEDPQFNQIPIIKIPEMYYIAAEAYAKGSQLDLAISLLNTVRSSRGIIEQIPDDASQEDVLLEVEKEYHKEFLSEGQWFYYLKRNGITEIPGVFDNTITIDDQQYVLPYPDNEVEFGNRN